LVAGIEGNQMISLIYISQSLIERPDRTEVLDQIEAASIARNSMLDLTGLLIASPNHFAQLLEGPILSVWAVMSSIMADPRHTDVRIVRDARVGKPCCPNWRMARFDSEAFGNAWISPLLLAAHQGEDTDALRRVEQVIEAVAMGARRATSQRVE
jgi:hypothetical protein